MNYRWNWGVFFQQVPSGETTYAGWLLLGLKWTVTLSLTAWIIALIVGSVVGVCRTAPNKWLSGWATAYVEVFRNIPLLVQLFIWYFVLPPVMRGYWRLDVLRVQQPYSFAHAMASSISAPGVQRALSPVSCGSAVDFAAGQGLDHISQLFGYCKIKHDRIDCEPGSRPTPGQPG